MTGPRLGRLSLGDFERGLLLAMLGAVLTVLYEAFAGGLPASWVAFRPILINAIGVGITAGIAYLLKNLGTNSEGKVLKAEPK